jgi:hypothetical protein
VTGQKRIQGGGRMVVFFNRFVDCVAKAYFLFFPLLQSVSFSFPAFQTKSNLNAQTFFFDSETLLCSFVCGSFLFSFFPTASAPFLFGLLDVGISEEEGR